MPSMLTVAPRGIEKLHTLGEIPNLSVQVLMLVGIAAELEESVKLVSIPSRFLRKKVNGLSRPSKRMKRP